MPHTLFISMQPNHFKRFKGPVRFAFGEQCDLALSLDHLEVEAFRHEFVVDWFHIRCSGSA